MKFYVTVGIIFLIASCGNSNQNTQDLETQTPEIIGNHKIKSISENHYDEDHPNAIKMEIFDTIGNKTSEFYIAEKDTFKSIWFSYFEGEATSEYHLTGKDTLFIIKYKTVEDGKRKLISYEKNDTPYLTGVMYYDKNGKEYSNAWRHEDGYLVDTNSYWYDNSGNLVKKHYYFGGETTEYKFDEKGNKVGYTITIAEKYLNSWALDLEHPEKQVYEIENTLNEQGDWIEYTCFIVSEPYVDGKPRVYHKRSRTIEYYE